MWLFLIVSLSSTVFVVDGMCFGAPMLDAARSCPPSSIYFSNLCLCLDRSHKDRMDVSLTRNIGDYLKSSLSWKDKLNSLRRRLTVSLPDMNTYEYASLGPISPIDSKMILVEKDPLFLKTSQIFSSFDKPMPRSWKIGGAFEGWAKDALKNGKLPILSTAIWNSPTRPWELTAEELTLMERLQSLRNLWRVESKSAAEQKLGDQALAVALLKHLPLPGVSPDTARKNFHIVGGHHSFQKDIIPSFPFDVKSLSPLKP